MAKKILVIGVEVDSEDVGEAAFSDTTSLLDWDIVLFRPIIADYLGYSTQYKGCPRLTDSASFRLKEACEHWKREIRQAVDSGKTVFVFLPARLDVWIDTGDRQYSGTGKNRATTHIVAPLSNYDSIPAVLNPKNASGKTVKLAPKHGEFLASYWASMGVYSEYRVLLDGQVSKPIVLTKIGDKPVGAIFRSAASNGALVCLPDLDFAREEFTRTEKVNGETQYFWSEAGERFSAQLITSVIGLDTVLRNEAEVTPEPAWAAQPQYVLSKEDELRPRLAEVEAELEQLEIRKQQLKDEIVGAGQLRALLYEKGKPLELAIIKALSILGFSAAPFKEGNSEFDVVFESTEGRLLGEAEGKDTKAINVDKLRQLAMNIHEDLQREEVTSPAKGVLFGNAYRLADPPSRQAPFTEKCELAARSSTTGLVATCDLFAAAQYLSRTEDAAYAAECRTALLRSSGLVTFPPIPVEPPAEPVQEKA